MRELSGFVMFLFILLLKNIVCRHLPCFCTRKRLSTCTTTMRVRLAYERRRYAALVKMRHGLAALNSNNSVVYGQKHKVCVLVCLVRTSGTF